MKEWAYEIDGGGGGGGTNKNSKDIRMDNEISMGKMQLTTAQFHSSIKRNSNGLHSDRKKAQETTSSY